MEDGLTRKKVSVNQSLLRFLHKLFASVLVVIFINSFLKYTGWETWQKFSARADTFANNIIEGTRRVSPAGLIIALKGESTGLYPPPEQTTLKERVLKWTRGLWYRTEGGAYWPGRIMLIAALIFAIAFSLEKNSHYNPSRSFFLNTLYHFPVVLLRMSLLALVFLIVLKLLLLSMDALVGLYTGFVGCGGICVIIAEEAQSEIGGSVKNSVIEALFPFPVLWRKRRLRKTLPDSQYQALYQSPMIPSFDIKQTVSFFTDTLGYKISRDDGTYVIVCKDNLTVHLIGAGKDIGQMEFYLEVDDVDAVWSSIKDKLDGIKVREPFDREYGMREIHISIPHTNTLMFIGQEIKK